MIKGITHIYDPIFMVNFYVIIGVPEGEAKRRFKRMGIELDTKGTAGRFLATRRDGNEIGIIWSQDKGVYLVHECLHAAVWALDLRGIPVTVENDEVAAYYQMWLCKSARGK
jgi:hypothetical protein